jgi:hypothetical protein
MTEGRSLLARYTSGDTDAVWRQLRSGDGRAEIEASAVINEACSRMARNIERILGHLQRSGYLFGRDGQYSPDPSSAWQRPSSAAASSLRSLLGAVGPLPLALTSWWSTIGGVSLAGYFPDIESPESVPYADPLTVFNVDDVAAEMAEMRADRSLPRKPPYYLPIAPDIFHKAGVSGGAPYEVVVPDAGLDCPLTNVIVLTSSPSAVRPWIEVETNETLVEYLARSFAWAGFPGLAFTPAPRTAKLADLFGQMEPI